MKKGIAHSFAKAWLFLAFALEACTGIPGLALPTPLPTEYLSTAVVLTVAASRPSLVAPSPSPTLSPTPTRLPLTQTLTLTPQNTPTKLPTTFTPTLTSTIRKSTSTPTVTSTPPIPVSAIQILSPGPGSRVISPIKLNAYLEPGAKGRVTIELLGEDGRLLARSIKSYYPGARVVVNLEIEYEIAAAAEASRLQISTQDDYGRKIALASVDLLLLSIGEADLNPPGELLEKIVIREPKPKTLIQGGKLWVSGLARASVTTPLIVELFTNDGKSLGPARLVNLVKSGIENYSAFDTQLSYAVEAPTWVRLTVSELSSRIPGATHLTSIEILLSP